MNTTLQQRIEEAAHQYIQSDAVAPENMQLAFGDFINGAKYALQNQWISVEKALPESIVQRVLVVNHHFPFDVYFGRYEYGKWIIEGESEDLWITHWAEIPSLKGDKE